MNPCACQPDSRRPFVTLSAAELLLMASLSDAPARAAIRHELEHRMATRVVSRILVEPGSRLDMPRRLPTAHLWSMYTNHAPGPQSGGAGGGSSPGAGKNAA